MISVDAKKKEIIGDYANKALSQCGESALQLGTAHQDAVGVTHAAARS